jgi:hypothetical protein
MTPVNPYIQTKYCKYLSLKMSNPLERAKIETTELLRRFGLAHKIHVLAYSCIDHYVQRSMAMSPSSLVKLGPYVGGFAGCNIILAFDGAESRPYQPHNTGPLSWVEEQRVVIL